MCALGTVNERVALKGRTEKEIGKKWEWVGAE